ncbi:MAG: hypothetical protein IKM34_03070 [Clostridia bacterium]|nr:hypothetical protein [Clostridia bacterium]
MKKNRRIFSFFIGAIAQGKMSSFVTNAIRIAENAKLKEFFFGFAVQDYKDGVPKDNQSSNVFLLCLQHST